jgi:peptidyl-prolyl cis-trans isomerase A (cyclophilin A)
VLKLIITVTLAALLTACGGGGSSFNPNITAVRVQSLQYSKSAIILVGGTNMRSDMVPDTGSCTNPAFRSDSTPSVAVLTCTVTATGALPIAIKAANGNVLFQATLNVPLPQVGIATTLGNFYLELNPAVAPVTVNNLLSYVALGYYSNTLFHRVIPGFVVQGGGYTTGPVKKDGQGAPIVLESNRGLSNVRGTVAMARTSDPNSATSEFFVNLVDNTTLDYQSPSNPGYAVFGRVVQGMDVVDAIAAVPTGTANGMDNVPTTDVVINLMVQTQ